MAKRPGTTSGPASSQAPNLSSDGAIAGKAGELSSNRVAREEHWNSHYSGLIV